MSEQQPIELQILALRMALRQRQYLRGGFWPRVRWYRAADARWGVGLNRITGTPIGAYANLGDHCLGFNWRFAPSIRKPRPSRG